MVMAVNYGPKIVTTDLRTAVDFGSRRSAPTGTGVQGTTTIEIQDLSGNNERWNTANNVVITDDYLDNTSPQHNGYVYHIGNTNLMKWATDPNLSAFQVVQHHEVIIRSSDTGGRILSRAWNGSGQYNYGLSNGGWDIACDGGSASISISPGICDGNIHHVAVGMTGREIYYYVDGGTACGGYQGTANHGIGNGRAPSAGDANLRGIIGTLYAYGTNWNGINGHQCAGEYYAYRMYTRRLTDDEVAQNFYAAKYRFGI